MGPADVRNLRDENIPIPIETGKLIWVNDGISLSKLWISTG